MICSAPIVVNTEDGAITKGGAVSNIFNGTGSLGGPRSFGAPPVTFRDDGVIYADSAVSDMIFPHIFHAGRYLSNPQAEYYLYYADYKNGEDGGQVAFSDSIETGWTEYSGNPLITVSDNSAYEGHVSSPWSVWDPINQQMEMYFHTKTGVGGQETHRAISSDGLSFSHDQEIITKSNAARWDGNVCDYLRVYTAGEARYGIYYGGEAAANVGQMGFAYSYDGDSWAKYRYPLFKGGLITQARVASGSRAGRCSISVGRITFSTIIAWNHNTKSRHSTGLTNPNPLAQ